MSGKLSEIKNCKKCGSPILQGSDDYCENCRREMHREKYRNLLDAENSINNDAHWLKSYSAWKSIITLPIVIMTILIIFYIISTLSDMGK